MAIGGIFSFVEKRRRTKMNESSIAKVCHEVNKAYCEALGDKSQPTWEEAPEWQRDSALCGVRLHLTNPDSQPEDSHVSWMRQKEADGWVYGPVKDPSKKEHPCMVPFDKLPQEQQAKDYLFRAVVHALKALCVVLLLAGCSSGLQETAFRDESGTYIVSRSLVNDRATANQPHVSGVFACDGKYTSEQMVELKKDGAEHSWYSACQPIEQYRPGAYHVSLDQPVGTIYKGPVEAGFVGAGLGLGLGFGGDTITQRGSSTSVAGASAQGGNAINKTGNRRR
jgi:RyR domain